ncbi:GNAT family N-acetyltransferase [Actinoallomurus sp. NBC_01490]|jgi:RimJ/RimL family protein N-acetyltransferase|uniref:GNAT family N-acetyltransferase n=1 Tax=Actinoallomurus sp. NBC_01490 TaxID=2903557 RepID=UPI002E37E2AF|nr:GNAT family protein [Actinoallomurus sp. NBC_01490]
MDEQLLTLCPVAEADLTILERLTSDPDSTGEFAWFGWREPGRYRRRWTENGLLGEDGGVLMVRRGEERLGFVAWNRRQMTPASFCVNMGIAMLPDARGKGYGAEAHRLLARYLFAHTTVHRIEADTEVGNIAEQKALERAGFSREGVMRGCGWRDGAWRDGVTYSILRTDPPV